MATKDKNGNWIDSRGKSVPPRYIAKVDKRRDVVVEKILREAKSLRKRMLKFKTESMKAIDDFVEYSESQSGVRMGGIKGNITLSNFAHDGRVEKQIQEYIDFDERLQQAKFIIDELLIKWSEGSRKELITIVNHAFEVDRKGKVNVKAILGLRRLKIKNDQWKKAMNLIDESRSIATTKAYIRFQYRDKERRWHSILLDLASIQDGE